MRVVIIIGALVALLPPEAHADAHEVSLHLQGTGGLASLGDPLAEQDTQSVPMAGGSVRFTWADYDALAWHVEGYGALTEQAEHTGVPFEGDMSNFTRRGSAFGLEAGATLRLGVRTIPTASIAVGPQLRLFGEVPRLNEDGQGVGFADSQAIFDVTARGSAGLDVRLSRRWVAGARVSVRQALGLGDGSWRSFEGTLHVATYWYPRLWTFPLKKD